MAFFFVSVDIPAGRRSGKQKEIDRTVMQTTMYGQTGRSGKERTYHKDTEKSMYRF
jgi:hypothetical protein